jgi:hypothetical protein
MIEDTAHRYYYRPHVGGELTFVDKSPAIHLTPCPACPDWPAGQQRRSAVRTNSRTLTLVVVGLVLAPPTGWLLAAWLADLT